MKCKYYFILLVTLFFWADTVIAQYMITNSSFNSGGSLSISNNINESILCSVAESFIGSSVNPDYQHRSGFWYIYQEVTGTDVGEDDLLPAVFKLEQNYPNPFNPVTQIKFSVPLSSNVKLIVTDILGREIAILINDELAAGNYNVNFDANNLSSGVYFYTLITDNFKQSKKMILMK